MARTSHLRDCAVTAVFGLTASHLVSPRCSRSVEPVQPKARIKVVAPDSTNTRLCFCFTAEALMELRSKVFAKTATMESTR